MTDKLIRVSILALMAVLGYLFLFGKSIEEVATSTLFNTTQSYTDAVGNVLGWDNEQKKTGLQAIIEQFKRGAIL